MAGITHPQIHCSICHKLVDLQTTKTDSNGKAVHEECYVVIQTLKKAPIARPRAS
jgi:hypothetical protein